MTTPSFSRLQLAAALIEYDNDTSNPEAPYRSAHDSAIFAHLRQNGMMRPPTERRQSDYLGVSVPSESGSLGGRESALETRRSRGSSDALRNPFAQGGDDTPEEDDRSHENLEVDLASWGLDAFMPKEKGAKGKGKGKAAQLPNPHDRAPQHSRGESEHTSRRSLGHRSMSLGNMDVPEDGSFPAVLTEENRRQSFSSPLDAIGASRDGPSSQPFDDAPIPFPSKSVRSPSPAPSHVLSEGGRNRANSSGTMATALLQEDNPFALEPPKHASRFDPKAALHARTVSNASLGSRILLENDGASVMTGVTGQRRDRPYSTVELLRPKILVMPSPLQSANNGTAPPPVNRAQDGFEISTDGPPLPPGARTVRPASIAMLGSSSSLLPPVPSNSFIPNPRSSLTLSQLTFRNELMVGGQRDVAYADLDRNLPRATQEGEQINTALPDQAPDLPLPLEDPSKKGRPAGKLYGTSLIDELENRKIQMRSKQRVFTGDQRPSMMARGQVRSSTLIDPATLQPPPNRSSAFGMPPTSPHPQNLTPHNLARSSTLIDPATLAAPPARASTFGIPETSPQNLTRRNSSMKPLLNFDDDAQPRESKTLNSRSVFGVDTLWEREMAKLKEIEEQEKLEAAARELEENKLADKKSKKKGKKKGKGQETPDETPTSTPVIGQEEAVPRVSAEPPILPDIPKAVRRPPPPTDNDEESEESEDDDEPPAGRLSETIETKGWGSSDEEVDQGPRRTTGTGLRYPAKSQRRRAARQNDDSEEDLPLSMAIDKVAQRRTRALGQDDDSDEEKPLSTLLPKSSSRSQHSVRSNTRLAVNEDDDDQPLGLRASRVLPSTDAGGDDDDTPLAFHPDQQRRTQYQMMAQAQQQQQFMMQAQNNMFFNPAMMTSGFFGPPVQPPMMAPAPIPIPMPIPSPPPLPDSVKFGRVDRWRHDVAVEGSR
ncbi:hypothetical protein PC9H_005376 [Pleurotus ostreatus]|uniref:Uncharacterized protein n=1 Tax=Pleurotus ostreatus TaxID=5322 RepID=A0A8H6ZYW9_PLEOS|nr:uncharacterized protein PC9H_005376 [Pleurotus ostreatus]KAF7433424.1 hypothetical protein PC9H_005376 [Pleurotus ostreatus]KAJ8697878.1 hypothetical protein PTI98_004649 [Pleurotus ostreatus]